MFDVEGVVAKTSHFMVDVGEDRFGLTQIGEVFTAVAVYFDELVSVVFENVGSEVCTVVSAQLEEVVFEDSAHDVEQCCRAADFLVFLPQGGVGVGDQRIVFFE